MTYQEMTKGLRITDVNPIATKYHPLGGMCIEWASYVGYGSCVVYWDNNDGRLHADTEYMCSNEDKRFLQKLLSMLVKEIRID